jgi:hypothetical protein
MHIKFLLKEYYGIAAIAIVSTLIPCFSNAQSNGRLIPQIAPTTPDAASLGRYGTYSVSHFTGIPEITIPLYEIEVGDLKVPISVSYHASGHKVTDRATQVGLGWSLVAGSMISRKVMGREDEHGYLSGEMKSQANVTNTTEDGLFYLDQVNRNNIDTEPDIYSYALGGSDDNGKFAFNAADNFKPIVIPYNSIKIVKSGSTNIAFNITDDKGVEYKMDEVFETTAANSAVPIYVRTGWMVSKMIAPNRQDTIKFSYTPWTGTLYADVTDYITVVDEVDTSIPNNVYSPSPGSGTTRSESIHGTEQKLSAIDYASGRVVFEMLTNRQDALTKKKLDRILVYTKDPFTDALLVYKTIEFHQSYFTSTDGTSTKRLRLDSIRIKDTGNTSVQRYKFEYNTTQNLPNFSSRSRDYWGYFNGKTNNTLVPQTTISYQPTLVNSPTQITIGSSDITGRDSDPTWMQANMMKKIHHPTGGWTEFTWQTNQYEEASQPKYAGGLRVYQIKSYDGVNPLPSIKTYKYGVNESGYGRANFLFDKYHFQTTLNRRYMEEVNMFCPVLKGSRRDRLFVSTPSVDVEPFDAAPVVYPTVTEYNGDETNNSGRTIYTFTDAADVIISVPTIGTRVIKSNHFRRGLLSAKEVYRKSGPSSYQKVSSITNTYQAYPDSLKDYVGFKCSKLVITDTNIQGDVFMGLASSCIGVGDGNSYIYGFYYLQTGDDKLTSSTETIYDPYDINKYVSVTNSFGYLNYNHQQLTSTSTSDSKGQTIVKSTKYPHDVAGAVYTEMVQKNLFDYPVEETTTLNSVQQEKITFNYYKFSANVFKPQTIYRQIQAGPNVLEVTLSNYDIKGNVLEFVAKDNVTNSFVWAYKALLPTASVSGATVNQIAFTSFEENKPNQGNWEFPSAASNLSEYKTGMRSHNLSVQNISKSGLNTSTQYVISYWAKNGTPSIIPSPQASFDAPSAEADGWRYFEKVVTNTSSIAISGSAYIDDLRLYPVGATMTNYAFRPGVGVSSVTDINNVITYYDYNTFGWLQAVKDHKKNIQKTYQYHYKNQY